MKHFQNTGRSVLPIICILLTAGILQAQTAVKNNWQLGLGVGYTNYYGDLSNYRVKGLKNINKFAEFNKYYVHQPSFSVLLQKKLTPTLGVMIQSNHLQFGMSDRYRRNNGTYDTAATNYSRSLNFRTTVRDVGLAFSFSPNNGWIGKETAFFYPSFYLGIGVSKFDVKGDLFDENSNQYNYRLPGNIMDGDYETNLREMRTETENKFRNIEPYVELGLALNFRINEFLSIALQSDIKYSASDYLDDVSANYKATYPTSVEQYAAKPGYNVVNPVTLQRGDNNGRNDFYINNRIVLNIGLPRKQMQRSFTPPVIYSLGLSNFQQTRIDSSKYKLKVNSDSLLRVATDSLKKILRDSVHNDSIALSNRLVRRQDSSLQKQLAIIKTELGEIKYLLTDKQRIPRQQQLQNQADSVKLLRDKILLQRLKSREDNLRLRIYNLQLDSLINESQKLKSDARFSAGSGDSLYGTSSPGNVDIVLGSSMNREDVDRNNSVHLLSDSAELLKGNVLPVSRQVPNEADQKVIDSLELRFRQLEQRAYSDSVKLVSKAGIEQRAEDSIARYKELVRYQQRQQQLKLDSLSFLQRQLQRSSDSVAYYQNQLPANTTQPDSLQKKSKWYQRLFSSGKKRKKQVNDISEANIDEYTERQQYYNRQVNNTQSRIDAIQRDTTVAASNVNDANLYDMQVAQLKTMLQRNTDSVALIKRQLQRSNDSAAYYKRVMFAESEKSENASQAREKWYKDLFTSEKKMKQKTEALQSERDNYSSQQQFYDDDVNRLRTRVDELESRNRDLNQEYESLNYTRKQRNSIEYIQPSPPVVYDVNGAGNAGNNNNSELVALRAELERLKNQVNERDQRNAGANLLNRGTEVDTAKTTITAVDSSRVNSLRTELDMIRNQLDSLRSSKQPQPVVTPASVIEKFDPGSFPVISVYFKTGAVILSGDQLNRLTPFAQVANKNAGTQILLKGFTDPVGNPAANRVLAVKRTEYVRNYLVNRHRIATSRIVVDEPASTAGGDKKPNPLDRRVDLKFER